MLKDHWMDKHITEGMTKGTYEWNNVQTDRQIPPSLYKSH